MQALKRVLFDAMILRYGVAEEPATEKRTLQWGERDVTLDVAATVSRRKREDWLQYEIDCLPKIADLVREGQIEPFINTELRLEVACLQFGGLVTSDFSVFSGIRFLTVSEPFHYSRIVASAFHSTEELDEFREGVFRTNHDQRFNDLKRAVGGNKNADAFHILSAERARLDYLLTTDRKLVNVLRDQREVELEVQVVYPSELLGDLCGFAPNPALHRTRGRRAARR